MNTKSGNPIGIGIMATVLVCQAFFACSPSEAQDPVRVTRVDNGINDLSSDLVLSTNCDDFGAVNIEDTCFRVDFDAGDILALTSLPLCVSDCPALGAAGLAISNFNFIAASLPLAGVETDSEFICRIVTEGLVLGIGVPHETGGHGSVTTLQAGNVPFRVLGLNPGIHDDHIYTIRTEISFQAIIANAIGGDVLESRIGETVMRAGTAGASLSVVYLGAGLYRVHGQLPQHSEGICDANNVLDVDQIHTGASLGAVSYLAFEVAERCEVYFNHASNNLVFSANGGGGYIVPPPPVFPQTRANFGFEARALSVVTNEFRAGDMNGDGVVNLLDVAPFVALVNNGGPYDVNADMNRDCEINLLDISNFVDGFSPPDCPK